MLVAAGAHVNQQAEHSNPSKQSRATHLCCHRGTVQTLEALVEVGADISLMDGNGNLPVDVARKMDHPDMVEVLLSLAQNTGEFF